MSPARSILLLIASVIAAPAAAQVPTVSIALDSYHFTPSPIRLAAGRPVRLTFTNRAGKSHDFTAPEFFASSRIVAGSAPDGEVELAPGQSATIELVPQAGTYKVHCSHFMHKQMGMKTRIIVAP
jgi:uncharacterized cupredoxin-like copper-binding protein